MPTMTMRLDETDAEVVRKYAEFEGKTISDFVRDAVFEKIEDQQDLATLREAIAADNGVRYTTSRYSQNWACKCPTTSSTATQPSSN